MTPRPSEVWWFRSPTFNGKIKDKYHLCIGEEGMFLFVSTHRIREKDHRGVLIIPNSDVDFLPPTETRKSEISCTTIINRPFPDRSVPPRNPKGIVERDVMAKLVKHVRGADTLTEDERDAILEILYDFYGADLA